MWDRSANVRRGAPAWVCLALVPPFVVGARPWPDAPCVVGDRAPGNTRARHSHRRSWSPRARGPMHRAWLATVRRGMPRPYDAGARRGHHVGARQTGARCAECEMWDRSANIRRGAPAWVCLALVPPFVVGARPWPDGPCVVGDRSPGNASPLRCRGEARPSRRGQANRGEIAAVRDVRSQRQRTPRRACVGLPRPRAAVRGCARPWPDAPCVVGDRSPGNA